MQAMQRWRSEAIYNLRFFASRLPVKGAANVVPNWAGGSKIVTLQRIRAVAVRDDNNFALRGICSKVVYS